MTGFNTQVGGGVYRIQIETDNQRAYKTIQEVVRAFVDLEQVVVSKMENSTVAEETSVCDCVYPENTKEEI